MKKIIWLVLALMPVIAFAQLEAGIGLGTSLYDGDLSKPNRLDRLGDMNLSGGGFVRYNVNNYLTARFSVNVGKLSAADDSEERIRNLSFTSNIWEFALTAEWNILGYEPYNLERVFSPFLFAGVALFKFNPQAVYEGQTYDLQPLGTEGQGLADFPDRDLYNLTQLSIPFGIGVKYALNDQWNLGFETGVRYTFTDYLDDVSKTYPGQAILLENRGATAAALSDRSGQDYAGGRARGNDTVNDFYFFTALTLSYNFTDNGLVGARGRRGSKTGCPTF